MLEEAVQLFIDGYIYFQGCSSVLMFSLRTEELPSLRTAPQTSPHSQNVSKNR